MIQFQTGNIFDSKAEALVNTVNTEGVMGKGIALQFKNLFPLNYKEYRKICKAGQLAVGQLLVVKDTSLLSGGDKWIINFPTKTTWRKPSEYSYIEEGLQELVKVIQEKNIRSIAIPPLGAGNGGLEWPIVKQLLVDHLSQLPVEVLIYEPTAHLKEELKKERVKLTPARAMLLAVLYELVRNGEFVSEFASEKVAYFLQRFGAKDAFRLTYQPNFYGPYSGSVRHVLYQLNGSYITGFSDKNRKPFEELGLLMDTEMDVLEYLSQPKNAVHKEVANKTKAFLIGYYSNFALELVSTVDFIANRTQSRSEEVVQKEVYEWSNRKKNLYANPDYITDTLTKLEQIPH